MILTQRYGIILLVAYSFLDDHKSNEQVTKAGLKQAMMQTGTEKLGQISCHVVYYEHSVYPVYSKLDPLL